MADYIDRTPAELEGDSHWIESGDPNNFNHFEIVSNDGATYSAVGIIYWWFADEIPEELGLERDTDEAEDYLNERAHLIKQFISERYGGEVVDAGDFPHQVEFNVDLNVDKVTEEDAITAVWELSGGVLFLNEMDAGTFGHIYAGRILTDIFRAYDQE